MHVLLHSVPLTLQQATTDPCLCQRLLDTPVSVSYEVTAPFSWVLVPRRFCSCPRRVYFPVLCKFWQLYGGLMATSSKRAYAIPRSAAPRAPILWKSTADPYLYRTRSNTVVSVSVESLGPGALKVSLSSLSISGGNGV